MDGALGRLGLFVVDHRRQGLVVDHHQFGRVLGHVGILGDDHDDRVPDVTHDVLGQWRPRHFGAVLADHGVPLLVHAAVEVGADEDRADPWQRPRLAHVDADDPRVGQRAADEADVQHAGQDDVVDVGALPGEQALILDPVHPLAGIALPARCGGGR